MKKGEIARYEQFLLFPQCFQKAGFPGASKGVIVSFDVGNRQIEINWVLFFYQISWLGLFSFLKVNIFMPLDG